MSEFTSGALAVVTSALLIALMHWAVGKLLRKPLPAWLNYVMGSLAILLGYAIWCWALGDPAPVARLAILYVCAGGMLILMYLLESVSAGQGHQRRADFLDAKHTGEDDDETSA